MINSSEALLVAGVFGFYVLNSMLLLYADELVFEETNGQWGFAFGSRWEILGRSPLIPNPLIPDAVLFRVTWVVPIPEEMEKNESVVQEQVQEFLAAVVPLRHMTLVLFVLLIIAFPLFLFLAPRAWLFIVVGLIYALIVAILIVIYRKRSIIGCARGNFVALAFESLACPPLALNILRRISLIKAIDVEAITFAKKALDAESFKNLVSAISDRVGEELAYEEDDSSRRSQLLAYRQRLARLVS